MKVEEIDNGINIIAETNSEYDILERFWKNGVDIISISAKQRSANFSERRAVVTVGL